MIPLLLFAGCSKESSDASSGEPGNLSQQEEQSGSFKSTGYKIKSTITPQTLSNFDPLTFEVYVDSNGNGKGLCGYHDQVYYVYIVKDTVFVQVDSNVFAMLSDITGHLVPSTVDTMHATDQSSGFSTLDGKVVSYSYSGSDMIIKNSYQENSVDIDPASITQGNAMTTIALIEYILDYESSAYTPAESEKPEAQERTSFYNDAELGVAISGKIYSIGDYCNPTDYFDSATPEGITPSYAWNKDKKVELLHVSYISSDGRTEFMLTDNYVQVIYTTSEFKFLDIYRGMPVAELKNKLGIGLRKDDAATFVPMVPDIVVLSGSGNDIEFSVGGYTVTIYNSSKDKTVAAIMVQNYIDFLKEG